MRIPALFFSSRNCEASHFKRLREPSLSQAEPSSMRVYSSCSFCHLRPDQALRSSFSTCRESYVGWVGSALCLYCPPIHSPRPRAGCHALALSLVQSYEFIPPEASQRPSSQFLPRRSLRRMSTVMDMELPSNLASRAPSPVPEGWPAPLPEAAAGGSAFREVLKKARVETKGPAEFSFDAFNF
jgi:hypothetical protein